MKKHDLYDDDCIFSMVAPSSKDVQRDEKKTHKKKKKSYKRDPDITDEELSIMQDLADDIERYIDYLDQMCICDNFSPQEYKKNLKSVHELVAMLRAGAFHKCIDEERWNEMMRGRRYEYYDGD